LNKGGNVYVHGAAGNTLRVGTKQAAARFEYRLGLGVSAIDLFEIPRSYDRIEFPNRSPLLGNTSDGTLFCHLFLAP